METVSRQADSFLKSTSKKENPAHRFPQRLFAFSSDLGLLSVFLKLPVLAWIGWLIALPYYAYSLIRQPDKRSQKEEALYQVTANGIFPLVEAKLGVMAGKKLSEFAKHPNSLLPKASQPAYKAVCGIFALLILTPNVGDKLGNKIVSHYQEKAS